MVGDALNDSLAVPHDLCLLKSRLKLEDGSTIEIKHMGQGSTPKPNFNIALPPRQHKD
jgi:hypothetical protein